MTSLRAVRRSEEPVRAAPAELARTPAPTLVRTLGRVRVPLALGLAPWATAYRLPSGHVVWCLRLREREEVLHRVVSTAVLRRYAERSGLAELRESIDLLLAGSA